MLTNERLTIVAETVLDDVKIASYGAVLNLDNMDLSLTNRYIDKMLFEKTIEHLRI